MRHVISPARILSQGGDVIRAEADYAVFGTLFWRRQRGLQGRQLSRRDHEKKDDSLKFSESPVCDSELRVNSLVYPA
ncbi:hypothetical protein [Polaromonas jejuensis]|uniref:hypothetical protein n=1 Tax=Polaromonas jejuensis TaxID=457502 RepID=UPI0012ED87F3|nr:hypothetical protein [Polaromonas jejuensis]